jgi:SLOG-like protein/TIR domain-containing protein
VKVFFILPELTLDEHTHADIFFESCKEEVKKYTLEIYEVKYTNRVSLVKALMDENSIIIFFNNSKNEYNIELINLIKVAKEKGVEIWPVAFNKDQRPPMNNISEKQSYDVYEQLRLRDLKEDYLEVIGKVFARKIISRVLPTVYNDNRMIFISHRRVDGEEIAAKLCDQLGIQARNNNNFRDVICVEVGEPAQDIIDKALSKSDVMIFLHTEKSAESEWIKKELIYAVVNNIPILWVNIDDADITKLIIKPTDKPHIRCFSKDFENRSNLVEIVDNILHTSFELAMISVDEIYDQLNTFKEFCRKRNVSLTEEDSKNLIFSFNSPRNGYVYPQRRIKHYVQCFGRRCNENDLEKMKNFLESKQFNNEKLYDSAILVSNKLQIRKVSNSIVEENYEDFNLTCSRYINGECPIYDDEIILSGSFTAGDVIYKQALKDAISILAKEILKRGFKLTFGAHPTFQSLIFQIGRLYRSNDYKNAINMYISKHFQYDIIKLKENATIIECEKISNDLDVNLTEMRTKMISNRSSIKALICLGGVIRNGDTTKGIDEEIKIARENNIPVFIIGSVGGRSSQIASEYLQNGEWSKLNDKDNKFNEEMALNLDYRYLANKIIETFEKQV